MKFGSIKIKDGCLGGYIKNYVSKLLGLYFILTIPETNKL